MRSFTRVTPIIFIYLILISCTPATPPGGVPTRTQFTAPTSLPLTPPPTLLPTPKSTPQGAWIQLEPDSGIPGIKVQVEGFLPGGLPQEELAPRNFATYASICWGGCQTGLEEDGLEVTWSRSQAGHFSFAFTVPPIPWLGTDGFHPLDAGDYSIDLINLDPTKVGCSPPACPEVTDASTIFHLTQSASYPPCTEPSCGFLAANPQAAAPGEVVQVTGWAPLVQFIGSPYGYNLVLEPLGNANPENVMHPVIRQSEVVLQTADGSLSASFRVPQYGNDGVALAPGRYTLGLEAFLPNIKVNYQNLVAPTPFEITSAPTWAQLLHAAPLWIQPAPGELESTLALDLLDPNRLAYCSAGAIQLSQDAGQSWASIPVSAASLPSPSEQLVQAVFGSRQPTCTSLTLDSDHPDSLYAVFGLMNKQYGMPPIYLVGYYTPDLGKTWQLVPVPVSVSQHYVENSFGGFWTDGKTVQVLYYGKPGVEGQPFPLLARQTLDGGFTWADAPIACPATGPCIRWGAAPNLVGGMGAEMPQSVLASPDGGKSWQDTGQSVELRNAGPHELVASSNKDILLISGMDRFPLRYSADGGLTWQAVALPSLPLSQAGYSMGYPGLQIAPHGSLLSMLPGTEQWVSLSPTGLGWCPVAFTTSGYTPGLLRFTGAQVWWLSGASGLPESAPPGDFICR